MGYSTMVAPFNNGQQHTSESVQVPHLLHLLGADFPSWRSLKHGLLSGTPWERLVSQKGIMDPNHRNHTTLLQILHHLLSQTTIPLPILPLKSFCGLDN
jgi:hypothetical protein